AFPDSFVVGVDLSSIQPAGHPRNCHFYAPFDFEFPWAKLGEESWDVIRLQMCGGSVVNWPSLYRRVSAHLRPDAWFEQVDIDFEPRCEVRALDGSALYNWYHNLRQATSDAARPISHQFHAIIDHLQNAGFTDIKHKHFVLPLSRWHSDLWMRHIGGWYGRAFFDSIEPLSLAPFRRILNWPPDEIQHLVTDAKSEHLHLLACAPVLSQIVSARGRSVVLTISLTSGTAYLRRRTELTLDQGDCADGSHSNKKHIPIAIGKVRARTLHVSGPVSRSYTY
ncbi:hypothetical protein KXV96_006319, partial [Aspergillus fumigatus]